MALREFLAYEGDATIAFVKSAPEIPRFDQVRFGDSCGMFNKGSGEYSGDGALPLKSE